METAGDQLRHQRLKLKLTFTQVSELTRIPLSTLKAIEKNRYRDLPGPTYIKGFIQNYAVSLRLDPVKILALFRRDYDNLRFKKILPAGLIKPLNASRFSLASKNLLAFGLALAVVAGYLGWSLYQLYQPPALTVVEPVSGAEVSQLVKIVGKTDYDATLTVNGKTINLEPDGRFSSVFQGNPGATTLNLTATSRRGKATRVTRHVIITK